MTKFKMVTSGAGFLILLCLAITPIYAEKWKVQVKTMDKPWDEVEIQKAAGWIKKKGGEYKIFRNPGNFMEAKRLCAENHGRLPEPRDTHKNDELASLDIQVPFFLGVSDEANEGTWLWLSDDSLVSWFDWVKWLSGDDKEPNGRREPEQDCVVMLKDKSQEMRGHSPHGWGDTPCENEHHVVCEKDTTWVVRDNKKYKVFAHTPTSFADAKSVCTKHDAILPEPKNLRENHYLANLNVDIAGAPVGVRNVGGKWVYDSDSSAVTLKAWMRWKTVWAEEPNGEAEHCVLMFINEHSGEDGFTRGGWADVKCSNLNIIHGSFKHVICEKDYNVNKANKDDKSYTVMEKKAATRKEAMTLCHDFGGKLPEPKNDQENLNLVGLKLNKNIWLGISEAPPGGDEFTLIGSIYYMLPGRKLSYAAALADCRGRDATLAEPRDKRQLDNVRDFMNWKSRLRTDPTIKYIWLGLSDVATQGTFVWESNGHKVTSQQSQWVSGQPGQLAHQDCVEYKKDKGWSVAKCDKKNYYICQTERREGTWVYDSDGSHVQYFKWSSGQHPEGCAIMNGDGQWSDFNCDVTGKYVVVCEKGNADDVYIILKGYNGEHTQELVLDNLHSDDFEGGALDTFELTTKEIGILDTIELRYPNANKWKVGWVSVENLDTKRAVYTFGHFDWVAPHSHLKLAEKDHIACGPHYFGLHCEMKCHCDKGCANCKGKCHPGWGGTQCMKACPRGTFGDGCSKTCHCAGAENCHIVHGRCISGCEIGWSGLDCQSKLYTHAHKRAVHHKKSYRILHDEIETSVNGAKAMCAALYGAQLPEPKVEQDNIDVAHLGVVPRVPLGISDKGTEGTWKYMSDKTDLLYQSFIKWAPSANKEPEPNGKTEENCAAMLSHNFEHRPAGYRTEGWVDVDCGLESAYGVVCEKDCPPYKFGPGCSSTCHCKGPADNCDMFDGSCAQGCAEHWDGHNCQIENCYHENGKPYMGTIHTTRRGLHCLRWSTLSPQNHEPHQFPDGKYPGNYCRKVDDGDDSHIWCYTKDGATKEWDECDVPRCEDSGIHRAKDYRNSLACEDSILDIECGVNETIQIETANYGREDPHVCKGTTPPVTDCIHRVTAVLRERCQDKRKCSMPANNDVFVDSCPGTTKYLEVKNRCVRRDWIKLGSHFYKVLKHKASRGKAKFLCKQQGGILPEPKDEVESQHLASLDSEKFYLGLTKTAGRWMWENSWTEVIWNKWDPHVGQAGHACAVMLLKPRVVWHDISCDKTHGASDVVCQKDTEHHEGGGRSRQASGSSPEQLRPGLILMLVASVLWLAARAVTS